MIRNFFRHVRDDFNAWRRGEVRVAPYGSTGRVFERKAEPTSPDNSYQYAAEPVVTVELEIRRADGTVEKINVPGEAVKLNG